MGTQELKDLSTQALFDGALVAAASEPRGESDDYWAYVRALHSRSGTVVFEKAIALCSGPEPLTRAAGADILAQLGTGDGFTEFPFADDSAPVLVSLLGDSEPCVTMSAICALGHLGRGAPTDLARLANHPDADVRCALAYALGCRDDDVSLRTLIDLSADADADTRNWATFGLGTQSKQDSPAIRDALAARLTDGEDEVRGEAMLGLAKRLDARAAQPILRELVEADVLTLAIEAAEEMPSAEFVPYLEELLAAHPEDQQIQRAMTQCRAVSVHKS
jgi:HEAT repeat protein